MGDPLKRLKQGIRRIAEAVLPIEARGIRSQEIRIEVQDNHKRVILVLPRDPFGEEERVRFYRLLSQSILKEFGYCTFVLYTT
ncbi:MAG TPA: hypothetical protein V6C82_06920 [Chroococcales cyanobacterium]|jgi:hypothetical protein